MKQGNIYNLCKKNEEFIIEEYKGWVDLDNDVGYYKKDNKWHMTELKTGCCFGYRVFNTRKEAIAVFEHNMEIVNKHRKTERYNEQIELFNKHYEEYCDKLSNIT